MHLHDDDDDDGGGGGDDVDDEDDDDTQGYHSDLFEGHAGCCKQ